MNKDDEKAIREVLEAPADKAVA
jgi:hypothetical protein